MSYDHGVLFPVCKGSLYPALPFAPSDCSRHHKMILHDSFNRECQVNSAVSHKVLSRWRDGVVRARTELFFFFKKGALLVD